MTEAFNAPAASELQTLAENFYRENPFAESRGENWFIPPPGGVENKVTSDFHHIIYGRRGTGKSSLLCQVQASFLAKGRLAAWTDQEHFKGLSYPDVLISTLIRVFEEYRDQLLGENAKNAVKRSFFRRMFRLGTVHPNDAVLTEIDERIEELADLKRRVDDQEIELSERRMRTRSNSDEFGSTAVVNGGPISASGALKGSSTSSQSHETQQSQRYRDSKSERLEKMLPEFQATLHKARASAGGAIIVIDDFYQLDREDQPTIAGYFHRLVKGTGILLKISAIEYRTQLRKGDEGIEVGQDINEVNLDRNLLEIGVSKQFLETISQRLAQEAGTALEILLTNGARDRLVLAAGGVPRDYLGLLGESISVAQQRPPSEKSGSERIIAEDVNTAAGKRLPNKNRDLRETASDDQEVEDMKSLLVEITDHCNDNNKSWFLVDSGDVGLVNSVERLQNMRYIHSIAENETLNKKDSKRYNVYLLDVSQLVHQRARSIDYDGWRERQNRRMPRLVLRLDSHGRRITTPEKSGDRGSVPPKNLDQAQFDFQPEE